MVAGIVGALEPITISLIRKRFLAVSLRVSLLQVALGGSMIAAWESPSAAPELVLRAPDIQVA